MIILVRFVAASLKNGSSYWPIWSLSTGATMETGDTVIVEEVIAQGFLGVVVIALAYWVRKLTADLATAKEAEAEAHEARVADAQKVIETMLGLNDKWADVSKEQTKAIDTLRSAFESLQGVLESLLRQDGTPSVKPKRRS